jgi:hypothetical protein
MRAEVEVWFDCDIAVRCAVACFWLCVDATSAFLNNQGMCRVHVAYIKIN